MMIAGLAHQTTEVAAQVQQSSANASMSVLGVGNGVNSQNHYTKLEFPCFDGSHLIEWVYKVEQFFDLDHTWEGSKVKMASIHFDGKALSQYKYFLKTKDRIVNVSWLEFIEAMAARFGEQVLVDPVS